MTITEFHFDEPRSLTGSPTRDDTATDIDLRSGDPNGAVEHVVDLTSGETITVIGANAYQPEGPMTTFFATGSTRGTIDSWSIRIASYRTTDISSIQRRTHRTPPVESIDRARTPPSLMAV